MRIGNWRGLAAAVALWGSCIGQAQADWGLSDAFDWVHTIPRVTYAKDYRTGGMYYAPPIPYGHYAKDPAGHIYNTASGAVHGAAGHLHKVMGHFGGVAHNAAGMLCGACGGNGCGSCGGAGMVGHGGSLGHGHGLGVGGPYNFAGGYGGGLGGQGGLFGGHGGKVVIPAGYTTDSGHGLFKGLFGGQKKAGHALTSPVGHGPAASPQAAPVASPQVMATGQGGHGFNLGHKAGRKGLGLFNHDSSVLGTSGGLCGLCGGKGLGLGGPCGGCGGDGFCGNGNDPCGANGACGACGGCGLLNGGPCGICGGSGLCGAAKGAFGHIAGAAHGALGYLKGLHPANQVKYFVGPGGPVPLTPGYVPYINPVRSPRDFFAFPPYLDRAMDGGAETWNYNTVTPSSAVPAPPQPGLIPVTPAFPLGGRSGGAAPEGGLGAGGDSEPMDDDVMNRGNAPGTGIPTTPPNIPNPGEESGAGGFPRF